METIRLPYSVPYYAQVASPELAALIFDGVMLPEEDPRWAESGAQTPQEYAYWVDRGCGVVCIKMCIEALGGPRLSLVDWAQAGLKIDGYRIQHKPDGQVEEIGWIHKSLADLCIENGLEAEARSANPVEIVNALRCGQMVIASVSHQIGTSDPVTKRGGHLVVVVGADMQGEEPVAFLVNNPSGRQLNLQAGAHIEITRFLAGYTGRVITVGKPVPHA